MKKVFPPINSEDEACEFAMHWREYTLGYPCANMIAKSYVRALEILLANGFNVNFMIDCGMRYGHDGRQIMLKSLLILSTDTYYLCSVAMQKLLYNHPDAHITEALHKHLSGGEVIMPERSQQHWQQTKWLLLEAGAKWPYDIKPEGCVELKRINVAKTRAITLLHGLKGMIPKDVIKQIAMEIYDNRLK